jgi:hypothetical protein
LFLHTNGDFLTPELAQELDGVLDHLQITLYMDKTKADKRAKWVKGLFKHSKTGIVNSQHRVTHFSPLKNRKQLIQDRQGQPCKPRKIIINHQRQYLLCCEDLIGNFDLGTFPEISLPEHWYGKRQQINQTLAHKGGRNNYPYCLSCPF